MDILERITLYKDNYKYELELKDKLYTRLAAVAVVFTACLSTQSSNVTYIKELVSPSIIFLLFFLGYSIFCVLAFIVYAGCFIHQKTDELVASSTDVENYHTQLVNYYDLYTTQLNLETDFVKNHMNEYLASTYAFCSTRNYDNNVYRMHCLNRMYILTIAMVICTLLSCGIAMYHKSF